MLAHSLTAASTLSRRHCAWRRHTLDQVLSSYRSLPKTLIEHNLTTSALHGRSNWRQGRIERPKELHQTTSRRGSLLKSLMMNMEKLLSVWWYLQRLCLSRGELVKLNEWKFAVFSPVVKVSWNAGEHRFWAHQIAGQRSLAPHRR